MTSTLCKIHVNNSTGVSLNERFTAMTTQPKVTAVGGRSRSRSVERPSLPRVDQATSRANQRFVAELQRKHKLQAAMKLKRRSMRTVGSGTSYGRIKRGSVKALRVGANGKPIRTNSLSNIATMNADREIYLANRLGPRRPVVGGAAQRIARRRLDKQRGGGVSLVNGARSRSRNRAITRVQGNGDVRSRSRSRNRNIGTTVVRGRSRSRSRNPVRSRSRSRNRGREINSAKSALPIKARLGVRPGTNVAPNNRPNNRNRRSTSLTRRGVQLGRVQKRRNNPNQNANIRAIGGNGSRPRSRSANRTNRQPQRSRSRSRTRKGQVGQQRRQGQLQRRDSGQAQQKRGQGQIQQRGRGQVQQRRPGQSAQRGRSQQRRGVSANAQKGSNNVKTNNQQRRGRSRSRNGGRGGPRVQGKSAKETVNKDELDKELDQYMATTKTENDMDFLLKN